MIYDWQGMDIACANLYDANGLEWGKRLDQKVQMVDTEMGIMLMIEDEGKRFVKAAAPMRVVFSDRDKEQQKIVANHPINKKG
jgi:hypothetical protein